MRRLLLALLLSAFLCGMCSCLNDDAQNNGESESPGAARIRRQRMSPEAIVNESPESPKDNAREQMSDDSDRAPHGHVGHTDEHDKSLDQEALVGGEKERKRLSDMLPEEAKEEIRVLVMKIDTDTDGLLSRGELIQWLKTTEEKASQSDMHNAFIAEDINQDGFVTFEEFLAKLDVQHVSEDDTQELEHKRFRLADLDKDGQLSEDEFAAFVNPSHYDHMMEHFVLEQLRMYDKDNDGFISFKEFIHIYSPQDTPGKELPAWVESEKQEFRTLLDVNKDMRLDVDEIKNWLSGNDEFFKEEAEHLILTADQNEDDLLSLEEVMEELKTFLDSPITDFGHFKREEL